MYRSIVSIVIASFAFLALPYFASAQTTTGGTYVSVGVGVNKMQAEDVHVHVVGSPNDEPGTLLTSPGPALLGAYGWKLPHSLRAEAEVAYRANHINGETGLAGEDFAEGTERKTALMGNVLYNFGGGRVHPYVGGGLGVEFVHEPAASTSNGVVTVSALAQTKSSLAYQAIAGFAAPVSRSLSFTGEYRYMGLAGTRVYKGTATVPGVGSFELEEFSTDDRNHTVLFGIRYSFGG